MYKNLVKCKNSRAKWREQNREHVRAYFNDWYARNKKKQERRGHPKLMPNEIENFKKNIKAAKILKEKRSELLEELIYLSYKSKIKDSFKAYQLVYFSFENKQEKNTKVIKFDQFKTKKIKPKLKQIKPTESGGFQKVLELANRIKKIREEKEFKNTL